MSPTLRRAHLLHDFAELGRTAEQLFIAPARRRHLALRSVPPAPKPGQLPASFAALCGPHPFDQECAQ